MNRTRESESKSKTPSGVGEQDEVATTSKSKQTEKEDNEDNEESAVVRFVTSNDSNYAGSADANSQEQMQQVIYVYGDGGPLFTFSMTEHSDSNEVCIKY
jgi:hypothetical protein